MTEFVTTLRDRIVCLGTNCLPRIIRNQYVLGIDRDTFSKAHAFDYTLVTMPVLLRFLREGVEVFTREGLRFGERPGYPYPIIQHTDLPDCEWPNELYLFDQYADLSDREKLDLFFERSLVKFKNFYRAISSPLPVLYLLASEVYPDALVNWLENRQDNHPFRLLVISIEGGDLERTIEPLPSGDRFENNVIVVRSPYPDHPKSEHWWEPEFIEQHPDWFEALGSQLLEQSRAYLPPTVTP